MNKMNTANEFKLSILGPGGGKTTHLIKEIINELPNLKPNRVMAIITYTNAATNEIKEKVSKYAELPENVFIGTIHSFLNRYILKPYGCLCKSIPQEYTLVKDFDFSRLNDIGNRVQKIIRTNELKNKLTTKGLVGYDSVESKANEIISNHRDTIRKNLSLRIQFLFLDEIQDATSMQYKILEELRKAKKTKIYCIGDPEQYIYGFTYKNKKRPEFKKIPINKLKNSNNIERTYLENLNHRSSRKIIDFLNHFSVEKQEYSENSPNGKKVIFIDKNSLEEIIPIFIEEYKLIDNNDKIDSTNNQIFFLSYANKTFDDVANNFGISTISNSKVTPSNILNLAIEYIISLGGTSISKICETNDITPIKLRKIGLKLIKKIKSGAIWDETQVISFLTRHLEKFEKEENIITKSQLVDLITSINYNPTSNHVSSSIHKAKGLEASGVLVIAKTKNELKKWLELNLEKRAKDKQDTCRLGFVAFSRAKDFLGISCLQLIDTEIKEKLLQLNVEIKNNNSNDNSQKSIMQF